MRIGWMVFLLVCAGMFVLAGRYRLAVVIGESMRPTLRTGDFVWVDRRAYLVNAPRESDVVLVRIGDGYLLKRIVGLPGQIVEVKSGIVCVDGVPREPSYPILSGDMDIRPGFMASGNYAVLGDNRALASEPTVHAVIARPEIVGKVVGHLTLWPERIRRRH